jgi:hypothetical protein
MAGSGIRVFSAGEILTAAQVNGYLMDQTVTRFADSFTRDGAFGGAGQPVLTEGRLCYLDDVNLIQFYDGASWVSSSQFTVGDGTISTAKLADDAVTGAKIADNAITAAHIADGTIIAADIADGSVTSAKILDGTIVNADINASAAIDKTKISGTAVTLADTGVVTSTMIENDTIINADIKSNAAIELSKLADATIDTKTGNYTLVLTDKNKFIEMNVGSANTLSIPTDASVDFPIGSQINITQYGTGKTQVVAVTPGTTSVRSTPGVFLRTQYSSATLIKRAANEWYLIGDLSAS